MSLPGGDRQADEPTGFFFAIDPDEEAQRSPVRELRATSRVALVARRRSTREWCERWCRSEGLEVIVLEPETAIQPEALANFPAVIVEADQKVTQHRTVLEALTQGLQGDAGCEVFAVCFGRRDVDLAKRLQVADVFPKPHDWELLVRRVAFSLRHHDARNELSRYRRKLRDLRSFAADAQDELRTRGNVEPISGLPSRQAYVDIVGRCIKQCRPGQRLAVVSIGFSRFGMVADALGAREAQRLLKEVGSRLADCLNQPFGHDAEGDLLATVLGNIDANSFAALLSWSGTTDQLLTAFRQHLMAMLARPTAVGGRMMHLSACLGIATYPEDADSADSLMQRADDAMTDAQRRGGGFRYHALRTSAESAAKLAIEHDLHEALSGDQLELYYQPIVDIRTGEITAAEALLRWRQADGEFLSPSAFVPVAEESGQILRLGEFVIDAVCRDMVAWRTAGVDVPTICMNVASAQLNSEEFAPYLTRALERHAIRADQLELEISERGVLTGNPHAVARLAELKTLGFRLSVDDFGTGESAIAYLKELPVDVLKIDKTYIDDLSQPGRVGRLAGAMIALAHELGLPVIAEGVEQAEQLDILARLDCDAYQGYLNAKPMNHQRFTDVLRAR